MMTGMAAEIDLESLPDPTRPYAPPANMAPSAQTATPGTPKPPPSLVLNYTLIAGPQRIAVINGKKLRTGDRIAGYTVVDVWPDRVRVTLAGKTRELTVSREVTAPVAAAGP